MKTFQLTIAQVNEPLFEGPATFVTVPGVEGEMTILPEHTALVSPLKKGVITVQKEDGEEFFEVKKGGTLEVSNNQVTVLL